MKIQTKTTFEILKNSNFGIQSKQKVSINWKNTDNTQNMKKKRHCSRKEKAVQFDQFKSVRFQIQSPRNTPKKLTKFNF